MGRTVRRQKTDFRRTSSDISQMREALQSIEIRRSHIHGKGLFARHDIAAGTRLIQYVGRKVTKSRSSELCQNGNSYIFQLNEAADVDG